MYVGISLGWRCEAAQIALHNGIRSSRVNGYKTCPFDLMVSNYQGMMECIKDDFKYFCDPKYLELVRAPQVNCHLEDYQNDDELWIYNTYYNFGFNHESPGHGNLYLDENWEFGINHFVENNFERFIERYNKRIENFRNYLATADKVNFIILRYNSIPSELCDLLSEKYENLNFEIHTYMGISDWTIGITKGKTVKSAIEWEIENLVFMRFDKDKYSYEYDKYYNQPVDRSNVDKRISFLN
jgi:hypothetical protein